MPEGEGRNQKSIHKYSGQDTSRRSLSGQGKSIACAPGAAGSISQLGLRGNEYSLGFGRVKLPEKWTSCVLAQNHRLNED